MTTTNKDITNKDTINKDKHAPDKEPIPAVNLSPTAMVDSVADWPLNRVVDVLKRKEKEFTGQQRSDPHQVSYRTGIRGLLSAVDELAVRYGVPRTKMSRWLSYHGIAIAREDTLISKLSIVYSQIRRAALDTGDLDTLDILNTRVAYTAKNPETASGSLSLYESWVWTEFQQIALMCGVRGYQAVHLFMLRSVLTTDFYGMNGVLLEFGAESERWDKWIRFRLAGVATLSEGSPLSADKLTRHNDI